MVTRARDGRTWRIGTDADVAWIANGTSMGRTITAAIPPVFEAYATVVLPHAGEGQDEHDRAVLALLSEQPTGQPRALGYLDTGSDHIAIPDPPRVTVQSGRHHGAEQGDSWSLRASPGWRRSGARSLYPRRRPAKQSFTSRRRGWSPKCDQVRRDEGGGIGGGVGDDLGDVGGAGDMHQRWA